MPAGTITVKNEAFYLVPKLEYQELLARAQGVKLPALPARDKHGYPASETVRALIARDIITRRLAAGWTQEELAKRAGVTVVTISRLESAKHKPQAATVARIDVVFTKAGV